MVGLLFRGCSYSSGTACSTRRCSCVSKAIKCDPGCRCKNCSNAVNTAASTALTPQQCTDDILEIEQELLHDDSLRRKYGKELVGEEDEDIFSSSDDEEDEVWIDAQ